jgi:hypothetical protein
LKHRRNLTASPRGKESGSVRVGHGWIIVVRLLRLPIDVAPPFLILFTLKESLRDPPTSRFKDAKGAFANSGSTGEV